MATFHASKRFHFSDNGRDPWAVFVRVPDSDPAVYEFETGDPKVIDRLEVADGVTRVDDDKPKRGRPRKVATESDEEPED